ncbi:hypothetical protein ACOZ38_25040 [Sphaerisporangium viridialbum]|uniref:hypothetical protein n=1 Tax=Sphaerisporangium viridialbum TaxID=46189 RepID=UPI003C793442
MISFLLLLALSGVVAGALYKRPDARAATLGGWRAGRDQAGREFRDGYQAARGHYDRAQAYLTRPTLTGDPPTWRNLRWWASAGFAVGGGTVAVAAGATYGLAKVLGGAVRVTAQAAQGAREAYREYKAAQPQDIETISEEENTPELPEQEPAEPEPAAEIEPPADDSPDPDQADESEPDLSQYDDPSLNTTGGDAPNTERSHEVNAEFTSFPQLQHDHATQSGAMSAIAGAIDGQVSGLLGRGMGGSGALVRALMAAQDTANLLAAQHTTVAALAAEQLRVSEAHASVGGTENVAEKEAYAQG